MYLFTSKFHDIVDLFFYRKGYIFGWPGLSQAPLIVAAISTRWVAMAGIS